MLSEEKVKTQEQIDKNKKIEEKIVKLENELYKISN